MKQFAIVIIAALAMVCMPANAQKGKEIAVTELYAFGFATTPADSVIYLTEIHKMPPVKMTKKGKFLVRRAEYSEQLKEYLEAQGVEHPACAIIFDAKEKKLMEKFAKIVEKSMKRGDSFIRTISLDSFTFKQLAEEEE